MFKKDDEQVLSETPNITTDEKTEITNTEIKQEIEKLKNCKFPRDDHMSNKLLRYGGNSLAKQIQFLI